MRSEEIFKKAKQYIPGGVNSPVRAFRAVGLSPRFIKKAEGCHITDEEDKHYIDYIGSWGPMILGHNHPKIKEQVIKACDLGLSYGAATKVEVEMAEFLCENLPHIDMIRMVNSGTEAVMSALRLARGYTKRDKIIKFAGCYHGHCDSMLVKAGSGVMTSGEADSAGVTLGCAKDTLTATYNDLSSVKTLLQENKGQVACIIVEPVAANMGLVLPKPGFLEGLRTLCDKEGALLIFDEVITGFRLGFTGAAGYFKVSPDLTTYGKIIGAGMPVGAYGGKKEIMSLVAPLGPVYQAGTLSGNPIAMNAGLTQLKILKDNPMIYKSLEEKGDLLFNGIKDLIIKYKLPCTINHIGALGCIFFTQNAVENYEDAKKADTQMFAKYFAYLLEQGIYVAPSQFEAIFISDAHNNEVIAKTLIVIEDFFNK